ncbi:MAG TPA: LiaF domain-containing protein [Polyangiaceae bacterium]|jgi:hypothetical protein
MADMVAVRDRRERAILLLSDAFAKDSIDIDEFERRLTLVHGAATVAEVDAVLADLEPSDMTALLPASRALVPSRDRRDHQSLIAVFGGVQRKGGWTPARNTRVLSVFGGAELDLRQARLSNGETELNITAIFGGAVVVVPPDVAVIMEGAAIFGGFEHLERAPAAHDPGRPLIRITGFALFGGVSVETRLAGESRREAHRRRRRERRERRRSRR